MKYRKKPIIVDAIQWLGKTEAIEELIEVSTEGATRHYFWPKEIEVRCPDLIVLTNHGKVTCQEGDYLIRTSEGEYYPCKSEVFEANYEPALN